MGKKMFGTEFRNKEFISKICKQLMQLNIYIYFLKNHPTRKNGPKI